MFCGGYDRFDHIEKKACGSNRKDHSETFLVLVLERIKHAKGQVLTVEHYVWSQNGLTAWAAR